MCAATRKKKTTAKKAPTRKAATKKQTTKRAPARKTSRAARRRRHRTWIIALALAGFAVLWFFGVEVAQTPAMAPNIEQGDWVLVYKPRFFVEYAYEPGDIVVVQAQDHESNLLRVIALEGDSVVQDCENLRLNALEVAQRGLVSDAIAAPDAETRVYVETLPGGASYRIQRDALELCSMQSLGIELPPGSVYALGDNRSGAYDSRQRGPYARHELRGKAWLGLRTASPNGGLLGRWFKPL